MLPQLCCEINRSCFAWTGAHSGSVHNRSTASHRIKRAVFYRHDWEQTCRDYPEEGLKVKQRVYVVIDAIEHEKADDVVLVNAVQHLTDLGISRPPAAGRGGFS